MNPLIGAAAISMGGNLLGSLLGFGSQERANKANMKLAEYQYSKALEMWNRQNEYNLPKNQMSRLTDAGLNPNLVYGNGTVQGLTSAPAPQYHAPTIGAYTNFGSLGAEQAVTTYMQAKQTDALVNKTNAETNRILKQMPLVDLDKTLKQLEIAKQGILNSISEKERDHWEEQYNMVLDEMQSRIDKNRSEVPLNLAKEENLKSDTDLNKAKQKTEEKKPALIEAQTRTEEKKPELMASQMALNYQSVHKLVSDILRNEHLNGLTDAQANLAAGELILLSAKHAGQLQENEIRDVLLRYGIDLRESGSIGLVQKTQYLVNKALERLRGEDDENSIIRNELKKNPNPR